MFARVQAQAQLFAATHGEAPADWKSRDATIQPDPEASRPSFAGEAA